MLLYNHPSGDATPSQDNIMTTRKVIKADKIITLCHKHHNDVHNGKIDILKI